VLVLDEGGHEGHPWRRSLTGHGLHHLLLHHLLVVEGLVLAVGLGLHLLHLKLATRPLLLLTALGRGALGNNKAEDQQSQATGEAYSQG
jgi:hypothetical protein